MTAVPTQRHPGQTNPNFVPVDACRSCGSVEPFCDDPGCASWGNLFDHLDDRRQALTEDD